MQQVWSKSNEWLCVCNQEAEALNLTDTVDYLFITGGVTLS